MAFRCQLSERPGDLSDPSRSPDRLPPLGSCKDLGVLRVALKLLRGRKRTLQLTLRDARAGYDVPRSAHARALEVCREQLALLLQSSLSCRLYQEAR